LIELPTDVTSRFLILPVKNNVHMVILLDDVIRYCLKDIFYNIQYESMEGYAIKLTRDAELDIDSDVSKSWMEKISRSVKMRKKGHPVRITYDENIPQDLLRYILKKIKLNEPEYLIPGGRYHNFKDFIGFPYIGGKSLRYPEHHPMEHPLLVNQPSMFRVIRRQDLLLAYPYQSFHHIIDLLREASIDPNVHSIKITLYRAAKNSGIINALVNAVKTENTLLPLWKYRPGLTKKPISITHVRSRKKASR
jgi:polyphosphate kinase